MAKITDGFSDVVGPGNVGLDKVRKDYFDKLDAEIPSELLADYQAVNAVHTIAQDAGVSAGNFTLTVLGVETANIAHDADAATIESAIDTALDGNVDGWTDGDISVSGGPLASADIVLTFDGDSVSGKKQPATTADSSGLTGGTAEVSTTTPGQKDLGAVQLLITRGVVNGDILDPDTWTRNTLVKNPSRAVLDAYAWLVVDELQDETAGEKLLSVFTT